MEAAGAAPNATRLLARLSDPARLAALPAPERSDPAARPAAVLVPVLLRPAPTVLLTLRAPTLSAHAGQVSFPGGRIEPGESAEEAALREAEEEVGLDRAAARVLGRLPEHLTGTGFRITPVLAVLPPPAALRPDPSEVAEAFEYALARLLSPGLPERREGMWRGRPGVSWVWPHERHLIWGATAAILRNLALLLRD
ncbi:MAG: CoA pyrophosphatase [Acetobacteraceae bacterium]|nr:CoA pyrophosphatase [Acetobacteraceae bacterium]MCX7684338.1 CoA pyrophosphatase [Acetobacteraceae bacterium]MDW8399519.1 CoA pyrophosphatase [Acetobacteraceae bacterium]